MSKAVLFEVRDAIASITLNRGDNRNSMTPELLSDFAEAITQVQASPEVRAVVITGKGSCFSAGADFKSNIQIEDPSLLEHERSYQMYEPFLKVLDVKVPVIAALNGHAVGGGFGLSLVCDIRIACNTSKYGANFTRLGLHPGMGISYLLPRLIGVSRANELLFTGRLMLGVEAAQIGLASVSVPQGEVLSTAMEMATSIANNAPAAVRLTKESIREHLGWNPRQGAYREAYAQAATVKMQDAKEGMSALLEKRSPVFTGK